jgi:hypothetical protein
MSTAANTVQTQMPKVASAAHAAAEKIPGFGGRAGTAMADDGATGGGPDDVGPDGNLIYPADGSGSMNGIRYSGDNP